MAFLVWASLLGSILLVVFACDNDFISFFFILNKILQPQITHLLFHRVLHRHLRRRISSFSHLQRLQKKNVMQNYNRLRRIGYKNSFFRIQFTFFDYMVALKHNKNSFKVKLVQFRRSVIWSLWSKLNFAIDHTLSLWPFLKLPEMFNTK